MGDGKTAFDAARFRAEAAQVIERLAAHLEAATSGATRPSPGLTTFEAEARFPDAFGEDPIASVDDVLERFLTNSNHQHHPGYVGHQVTSPLPRAALFDLVGSLLNNGMAAFESGPAAVAMERAAVRFLCAHAGFPLGDGVLTSGGSLGNLTALLVARQARAGFDGWESGLCAGPPLAVLASADAHYSVSRAAGVLGLGARAVIGVPVDAERRMRADALPEALSRATSEGRRVIAVVANAGSTVTGAIDPLEAIASFCEERGLWLHVDGAHGASLLISDRLRERLRGIERADSLVWDAHKLMLVPALSTAVLFRRAEDGWLAFSQEAPYLYGDGGRRAFDLGQRTVECTKRTIGATLYAALATEGTRFFAEYVEGVVALAARFATMVERAPDFELLARPECNIVCFRHVPRGVSEGLDALQERARAAVIARGGFFLVQTRVEGRVWLRTTLTNPLTTPAHLDALLSAIREAAA